MNIDNKTKKAKGRDSIFSFGDKEKIKQTKTFTENKKKADVNPNQNNNGFDFNNNNPEFMNNEFGNDFAPEEYPTMDLVSGNSAQFTTNYNIQPPENYPNLSNPNSNEFVFQENDFNFDK